MSHILYGVEFPPGRRPPPIVLGNEQELWLEGSKDGLEAHVAVAMGKEVLPGDPLQNSK